MIPGDVWDRNGTLFALDLSTALRIEDLLSLKYEHLRWQEYPTRLSVYITDGKTDKFSVGKWTTDFVQSPHNMNDGLASSTKDVCSQYRECNRIHLQKSRRGA